MFTDCLQACLHTVYRLTVYRHVYRLFTGMTVHRHVNRLFTDVFRLTVHRHVYRHVYRHVNRLFTDVFRHVYRLTHSLTEPQTQT